MSYSVVSYWAGSGQALLLVLLTHNSDRNVDTTPAPHLPSQIWEATVAKRMKIDLYCR